MKDPVIFFSRKNQIVFSLLTIILLGLGAVLFYNLHSLRIGPEQPVPFSHRLHANEKMISCFMCHEGAMKSERAGIPPTETCMLCHDNIIIRHPEIEKLRTYYAADSALEWVKVTELPDFVFFNHSLHIYRKLDCSECHGNVLQMDRIERTYEFKMKFCVDCHRENKASLDCFTCHR